MCGMNLPNRVALKLENDFTNEKAARLTLDGFTLCYISGYVLYHFAKMDFSSLIMTSVYPKYP